MILATATIDVPLLSCHIIMNKVLHGGVGINKILTLCD